MNGDGHPLGTLVLLAALSLIPFVLVMITSFAKVAVVLHILRAALGAPQVPPTVVITGLAIILTAFIMAPTGLQVYQRVEPQLRAEPGQAVLSAATAKALLRAGVQAKKPMAAFLARHSHARERRLFAQLARKRGGPGARATEHHLMVLIPAFAISQLKSAFEIGFLLFIPFLIIELVVSNILVSLGMHALSPPAVSLPFKLLLFVMADGWYLLAQGLVMSYG